MTRKYTKKTTPKIDTQDNAINQDTSLPTPEKASTASLQTTGEDISVNPNDAETYLKIGISYWDVGENDKAIANYNEALRLDPNYANALYYRGIAYYEEEMCDLAIKDYDEAIRIKPNYGLAFLKRGTAYLNKGEYDKAMADYTEAFRLNPNLKECIPPSWEFIFPST